MPPFTSKASMASALVATFLLAAGCGSSSADDGTADIATLGGQEESTPRGDEKVDVEAPENPEDAFALFDECMGELGIEFDTVVGSSSGALTIEGSDLAGSEVDPQAGGEIGDFDFEDFEAANDECSRHLDNIDGGFDLSPEQEAAFEDAQLEWQDCMEEQGIEIPDLVSGGGIGSITIEAGPIGDAGDPQGSADFGDIDFDFSEFEDAASECDHIFEEFDGPTEGDDQ